MMKAPGTGGWGATPLRRDYLQAARASSCGQKDGQAAIVGMGAGAELAGLGRPAGLGIVERPHGVDRPVDLRGGNKFSGSFSASANIRMMRAARYFHRGVVGFPRPSTKPAGARQADRLGIAEGERLRIAQAGRH